MPSPNPDEDFWLALPPTGSPLSHPRASASPNSDKDVSPALPPIGSPLKDPPASASPNSDEDFWLALPPPGSNHYPMSNRSDPKGQNVTACAEQPSATPNPNASIHCLPPEIISRIFVLGSLDSQEEFIEDGESASTDDPPGHFATLCSHVCHYWRSIAIDTPQLWSYIDFEEAPPFEKSKEWIARSKATPLTIEIDHTPHDYDQDENLFNPTQAETILMMILNLISPETHRWHSFDLVSNYYELIWLWQRQLVDIGPFPILKRLALFCYEDIIDDETFQPQKFRSPISIFQTGTPKLQCLVLWGVHLDWEATTILEGLKSLHLAYHTKDVRLSYEQFTRALRRSPDLEALTLECSAPSPLPWVGPHERVVLNSLRDLAILFVGIDEALTIVNSIEFPALVSAPISALTRQAYMVWQRSLELDLEDENMKPFIDAFCSGKRPRFQDVESLKLTSFQCRPNASTQFLRSMPNIKSMTLNFNFLPLHFRHALAGTPYLCPKLDTLKLSGLEERTLKNLIKARNIGPTPISHLYLDLDDEHTEQTVKWLKQRVETVKFYEASGEENEEDDDEEDEEDEEENGW